MTSVKALYEDPRVSAGQRAYFWRKVAEVLSEPCPSTLETARRSLSYIWCCYDSGGHSVGRSLRSRLLECAMKYFDSGNTTKTGEIIVVLIAMYHNHEHIERAGWYDYTPSPDCYPDSSSDERVHLAVVAQMLGVDDKIPDIGEFSNDDFLAFLKD
jgi:hypothetical protein